MSSNTVDRLLAEQERIEQVKAWLATIGTTLWADWHIDDEDGRTRAAQWFIKQMDSYGTFAWDTSRREWR